MIASFSIHKDKVYFWSLIFLAFLCPLLALPLAFIGIYYKKPEMLYPIALSLAILLCLVPITDDAYNYYRVFIHYSYTSFADVFTQNDFLFYLLSYFCQRLGLSYFFLRFFLVTASFSMLARIFIHICKQYPTIVEHKHYFILSVLAFILAIDFVGITNAMRYSSAMALIAMSFFFATQNKIFKSFIFYILAVSMHFGAWLYLPVFLVLLGLHKWNISLGTKLILLLIAYLCGKTLFGYLYSYLPSSWQADIYITGYWANIADYRNTHGNWYAFLHRHLISISLIPLFLFKGKSSFNLEKVTFGILLTYIAYLPLVAVSGRVFSILSLFIIFTLIITGSTQYKYTKYIRLWFLIGVLAFSQSLDIYRFREALSVWDNIKFWSFPISYLCNNYYTSSAYLFQDRNQMDPQGRISW
ncbi:MAG: EpsG family protein [Elusimicrobia bacterium]|nr:EpsG family protein [Elusimicrobiota bacterium]